MSEYVSENDFFESTNRRPVRHFIVPYFPESYTFTTNTRNEIKSIKWFDLDEIENFKSKKFKNAACFIPKIKAWIAKRPQQKENKNKPKANSSFGVCKFGDIF